MKFSELEAEWHPTLNLPLVYNVSLPMSFKYWWLGVCGHEWEAKLSGRLNGYGYGCSYCGGKKVLAGFNDLASQKPHLVSQWHPTKNEQLTAEQITPRSGKKVWWQCSKGHEWEATPSHRVDGRGCPYCSNKRVLVGFNDLATTNPVMGAEWNPTKNGVLSASHITARSGKKVWWQCSKGHEWEVSPHDRKNHGCPICANKQLLGGFNDLETVLPELATEWHPLKNGELLPEHVLAGTHRKVWWLADCGHEWQATPDSRKGKGRGCPVCASKVVLPGYNDLATTNPVLAAEWHPIRNEDFTSQQITAGSNRKAWWLGQCNHEWEATLSSRHAGNGCPICSGSTILVGFNDLATTNPTLAVQWHPTKNGILTPKQVSRGTVQNIWWLGVCLHEWEATPNDRTRGNGCPVCDGKKVLVGFNDLATTSPAIAAEWHPTKNGKLTAQQVIAGTSNKVWWLGKCGHEWKSTPNGRTGRGDKCPFCSGKRVLVGFNDLGTVKPQLAAEWHPTKNGQSTAQHVTSGASKRRWWLGVCGHEWEALIVNRTRGVGCPRCANNVSKSEEQIKEYLEGLNFTVESSNRKILNGKELDLWIPEKQIAIEFNGLYWHNEKFRGKDSHYKKWLACKNLGIQLIQIWEDDWKTQSDIIMKSLAHTLGASKAKKAAQKMNVTSITSQQAGAFLTEHHLQGFVPGSYYLGLMSQGDIEKLQAVLVLEDESNFEGKELNIVRYATRAPAGQGFRQLITHASNTYRPELITAISDHCTADGRALERTGFVAQEELPADYMYVVRSKRIPKTEYPLERFQDDPKLLWEEGLTEMDLADLNGLDRIWDAGKTRYRFIVGK